MSVDFYICTSVPLIKSMQINKHKGVQAKYFMLNGFLVWFNVFLLNPNLGEPFRSPFCGKRGGKTDPFSI